MACRLDVVVVDDDPSMLRTLVRALSTRHAVRACRSASAARTAVAARVPDVLVTDHDMPDETGADLLRWMAATHPRVRRVLLSATDPATFASLVTEGVAAVAVAKQDGLAALLSAVTG